MNSSGTGTATDLVDRIALELQRLRAAEQIDANQPLLRIDNRRESAAAPFQFDISESVLHRTGCASIPKRSRSALYALWEIQPEDLRYACSHCRPAVIETQPALPDATDLIYGFLSVLDQFGSLLTERGREYRASERGRAVETTLGRVISELDGGQQQLATVLVESLDGLVRVFRELADSPGPASNGTANGHAPHNSNAPLNGHAPLNGRGPLNGNTPVNGAASAEARHDGKAQGRKTSKK